MARFSPGLQSAINNLMSGRGTPLRLNPAGRTIEARRSGTCPISGEAISPGDSITKTEAGRPIFLQRVCSPAQPFGR